jgi:hypothetical protein
LETNSLFGTLWAALGMTAYYLALVWINTLLGPVPHAALPDPDDLAAGPLRRPPPAGGRADRGAARTLTRGSARRA